MERIRIIQDSGNFNIQVGPKNRDFINRLKEQPKDKRPSDEELETLQNEAAEILSNCINPIDSVGNVTGLAFGYVQSGKTMSFTTLTTLAADNGFKIIIYFAGIKNNLLEQTTDRLKKDLSIAENSRNYRVYKNPKTEDKSHSKIRNNLRKRTPLTILITVLKTQKYISELKKIFNYPDLKNELSRSGVLIIDDEADQASLNTFARKNSKKEEWEDEEFSPTYNSIMELKSSLPNHSYIQYTATPQGPLLINIKDLLSPKFHIVLTPGKKYTGGKTFFIDNKDLIVRIPDDEVFHPSRNPLETPPKSLMDSLKVFLIAVAIQVNILKTRNSLSMLIHADQSNDASKKFSKWVDKIINNWGDMLALEDRDPGKIELLEGFEESYNQAVNRINPKPSFEAVMYEVEDVIYDTNSQLYIQKTQKIDWSSSSNIIIGAEKLNRGFTIKELAVTYMPRHTVGKPNSDTMQQRCRFFGYKKEYLDSCRVYLPRSSINEYKEYVEHEETTREKLKTTKDINDFTDSRISNFPFSSRLA